MSLAQVGNVRRCTFGKMLFLARGWCARYAGDRGIIDCVISGHSVHCRRSMSYSSFLILYVDLCYFCVSVIQFAFIRVFLRPQFIMCFFSICRRYTYMKTQLVDTEYFNDEAVKARCPALYHQYVGQYMNQREASRQTAAFKDMSFSSQLLYHMDAQQVRYLRVRWWFGLE